MAYYKVCLTLSALITCHVSANYEYERLRALRHLADISQIPRSRQYDVYEAASSDISPYYSNNDGPSEDRFKEVLASPSERSLSGSVKKGPSENKSSKKPLTSSFYAPFANKGSTSLRSAVAHCQEIKVKSSGKESEPRRNVTCYRCKDPSNGSTYERCFYNTQLESESPSADTKVERRPPASGSFRHRRSYDRGLDDYGKPRNPYRFTEEYFTDATYEAPAAYEKKGEKCDKVVKDSMVCIVCKDAKTNGKYEQCSYVKQPQEKAYSYVESRSSGKPEEREEDDDARQRQTEVGSYSQPSDIQEYDRPKSSDIREYDRPKSSDIQEYDRPKSSDIQEYNRAKSRSEFSPPEKADQGDETQETLSADCKQVQKDSKTCTVCKDSKRGGTYEKCSYNYQPSDKLYKYSRSKSFGYPDKTADSTRGSSKITQASNKPKRLDYPQSSESTREDAYFDKSGFRPYPRESDKIVESESADDSDDVSYGPSDYSNKYYNPGGSDNYTLASSNDDPESYAATPSPGRVKSDSESYSADINQNYCKKVKKDSMTCTVCQDPKTGNDFERCSYSYEPSDKLFSYTKSKSFNSSKDNDGPRKTPREDEQSDGSDTARGSYGRAPETYEASATDEARSEDDEEEKSEVIPGYVHTAKKKAEIEGFLRDFRKEDRSKCKKIIRDKMTCYQCVDEGGAQKEECVFVAGREPDKEQLAFHEVKEFQIGSASRVNRHRSPPGPTKAADADPLEPNMSASKNSYVRLEKPDSEYPDETRHTAEETKETEPYDYTSETRPRYDKVLGLTLPAYMFATSEHEAAFDEVVASSYEQR